MNPTIRTATAADLPFLWNMLFESAFTTDEQRATWRADPQHPPELKKYLDGWGRAGDFGVIAQDDAATPLGGAWYRIFDASQRGDGIMSFDNTPELAIAVEPAHRGHGIGAILMTAIAQQAKAAAYPALLLSVDPNNAPALHLYERTGYVHVETDDPARGTSLIMRLAL